MRIPTLLAISLVLATSNLAAQSVPIKAERLLESKIASELSQSRNLMINDSGNTIVLSEAYDSSATYDSIRLQAVAFNALGARVWRVDLGAGFLVASAALSGGMVVAIQEAYQMRLDSNVPVSGLEPGSSISVMPIGLAPVGPSTTLTGVSTVNGRTLWSTVVPGSVVDLVPDKQGGLRMRYVRSDGDQLLAERLAAISSGGTVLWDVALNQ